MYDSTETNVSNSFTYHAVSANNYFVTSSKAVHTSNVK